MKTIRLLILFPIILFSVYFLLILFCLFIKLLPSLETTPLANVLVSNTSWFILAISTTVTILILKKDSFILKSDIVDNIDVFGDLKSILINFIYFFIIPFTLSYLIVKIILLNSDSQGYLGIIFVFPILFFTIVTFLIIVYILLKKTDKNKEDN